jgi:hypothetical protein
MSTFNNGSTTRYKCTLYPADGPKYDHSRSVTYYVEARDYWDAKRTLNAMFGSDRWDSLTEAR